MFTQLRKYGKVMAAPASIVGLGALLSGLAPWKSSMEEQNSRSSSCQPTIKYKFNSVSSFNLTISGWEEIPRAIERNYVPTVATGQKAAPPFFARPDIPIEVHMTLPSKARSPSSEASAERLEFMGVPELTTFSISSKVGGNTRQIGKDLPPYKIRFDPAQAKNATAIFGAPRLDLITHGSRNFSQPHELENVYLVKEFLAYRMAQFFMADSLAVQLAKVTYFDPEGRKAIAEGFGLLREAKASLEIRAGRERGERLWGEVREAPRSLDWDSEIRGELFRVMISDPDHYMPTGHNWIHLLDSNGVDAVHVAAKDFNSAAMVTKVSAPEVADFELMIQIVISRAASMGMSSSCGNVIYEPEVQQKRAAVALEVLADLISKERDLGTILDAVPLPMLDKWTLSKRLSNFMQAARLVKQKGLRQEFSADGAATALLNLSGLKVAHPEFSRQCLELGLVKARSCKEFLQLIETFQIHTNDGICVRIYGRWAVRFWEMNPTINEIERFFKRLDQENSSIVADMSVRFFAHSEEAKRAAETVLSWRPKKPSYILSYRFNPPLPRELALDLFSVGPVHLPVRSTFQFTNEYFPQIPRAAYPEDLLLPYLFR